MEYKTKLKLWGGLLAGGLLLLASTVIAANKRYESRPQPQESIKAYISLENQLNQHYSMQEILSDPEILDQSRVLKIDYDKISSDPEFVALKTHYKNEVEEFDNVQDRFGHLTFGLLLCSAIGGTGLLYTTTTQR